MYTSYCDFQWSGKIMSSQHADIHREMKWEYLRLDLSVHGEVLGLIGKLCRELHAPSAPGTPHLPAPER